MASAKLGDRPVDARGFVNSAARRNGCFGVRNEDVSYTVSDKKLLLTSGLRIVRDEAMLQFEDLRAPEAAAVSKTSGR